MYKRKYLSGAAKREKRKEKDKNLARGKRTLEDLGWGIKKPRVDLIDETEIATDDGELSMDERSFSKLSLVKSCIRSTMLQERLSALVMLSAERELAKTLDYNDIINSFAVQKSRKALLQ